MVLKTFLFIINDKGFKMDLKGCFVVSSHSLPPLLSRLTYHSVEERCLGDCALGEGMCI